MATGTTSEKGRFPARVAGGLALIIKDALTRSGLIENVVVTGSLRRDEPFVGDIDLMGFAADPKGIAPALKRYIESLSGMPATVTNLTLYSAGWTLWRWAVDYLPPDGEQIRIQVDLSVYQPDPIVEGARLLHHTGSKWENIRMRNRAVELGMTLSQNGLIGPDGKALVTPVESSIYEALGLPFKQPNQRK